MADKSDIRLNRVSLVRIRRIVLKRLKTGKDAPYLLGPGEHSKSILCEKMPLVVHKELNESEVCCGRGY